jgi:hypothetical protein
MESVQFVVEVHSSDEFGEAPVFAVVEITPDFLGRLNSLSALCRTHALESVSVSAAPAYWHREDELRIVGSSLLVHGDMFWYEAYPKHATYQVDTHGVNIEALLRMVEAEEGCDELSGMEYHYGILFHSGSSPEELAHTYLEALLEEEGGQ